jgi:hypothetical protein
MEFWPNLLAAVALAMAVTCFTLFVLDAIKRRPNVEDIAARATEAARDPNVDSVVINPAIISAFVTSLSEALSKVGPGLVALIGSLLFFLLSGMAVGVYTLASEQTSATVKADAPAVKAGLPEG